MKKLLAIIAVLFTAGVFLPWQAIAQAPQKMSYQAEIRDINNVLVTNAPIGMKISILQSSPTGTAVYTETQTTNTNSNGLVSTIIGGGIGFDTIQWEDGPYYIKTETDPGGGANYTITGTSQLLSVPFALFSANSTPGPQGPQGPTGLLTSGSAAGATPFWDGSSWVVSSTNVYNNGGSVGIGTSSPISSAKLDVSSTSQLFYPPRMTEAQRDAIVSPAAGGILFNTTTNKLQVAVPCANIDNSTLGSPTLTDPITSGQTIGQTFLAEATNTISQIGFYGTYGTLATGDISCSVYTSVGGTLLATSPNIYDLHMGNGLCLFSFSGLDVIGRQNYYIEFTINYAGNILYHNVGNPYDDGEAYYNGEASSYDVAFSVNYSNAFIWENLH